MRILVIGGNGFIGSHLVDELVLNGYQVRVFDRSPERFRSPIESVEYFLHDFNDTSAIAEALEGVDVVYHLLSTTVPSTSNLDPISDIQNNLIGTLKLLQLMVQKGISRIVYLSSGGTVYGIPKTDIIPETHELNPICSYGVVKVAIEKYLLMFQQTNGLRPVILRPSNPYGERQGHGGVQGVIGTFLSKMKSNERIEVWGDGSVIRDFIHVTDLAELCRIAMEKNVCGVFNAGSGQGCSILTMLDMVRNVTGVDSVPIFKQGRSYDVPKVILDISLAQRELRWEPKIDLLRGLVATWQWMQHGNR